MARPAYLSSGESNCRPIAGCAQGSEADHHLGVGEMSRLQARVGLIAVLLLVGGGLAVPTAPAAELGVVQVKASDFDSADFPASPVIDNPFLPWTPGTRYVYDGEVVTDGQRTAHRIVIVVTDLVKVIDQVPSLVILDRDFDDGVIAESELAFQAQDGGGTVWSLGEYPEEYEDGTFVTAERTWLAGVARARAGILMLNEPVVGGPSYSQGRAPEVDFADRARVIASGQHVCVKAGCFNDVLVTDEWDALDPAGGHQIKYHAPGIGVVLIEAQGGDAQETLELVRVSQLGAVGMERNRNRAIRMDRRAYRRAADVYADSPRVPLLP